MWCATAAEARALGDQSTSPVPAESLHCCAGVGAVGGPHMCAKVSSDLQGWHGWVKILVSQHTNFIVHSALKQHQFRKLLKECASNLSGQWLLWSQIQENRFLKIIKTAGKYNQLLMPLSEMAVLQITENPN